MRVQQRIGRTFAFSVGLVVLLAGVGCSSMEPAGMQAEDGAITGKVKAKLYAKLPLDTPRIHVDTSEHVVYLFGTVNSAEVRAGAERIARDTGGVWNVVNDLTVGTKSLGQSIDDATIEAKIKAAYFGDPLVKAFDVEVYSSKGVVTLIGRVNDEAAKKRAEVLARETEGVKSVVDRLKVGPIGSRQ